MDSWSSKDPEDYADYFFDWARRLEEGETITEAEFVLTGSATAVMDREEITGALTKVWIRGGELGEVIYVTCNILTSETREWDKTARLRIRSE